MIEDTKEKMRHVTKAMNRKHTCYNVVRYLLDIFLISYIEIKTYSIIAILIIEYFSTHKKKQNAKTKTKQKTKQKTFNETKTKLKKTTNWQI